MTTQPDQTGGQLVPGPWQNGQQEGCCPGRANGPGLPYTPHYFAEHKDGSLSLRGTAARLPVSELGSVRLLDLMNGEAGARMIYGHQTSRWLAWDGSVYAPQDVTNVGKMTEWLAGAYKVLLDDIRAAARCEAMRELGPDVKDADLDKATDAKLELFAGHRAYCAKLWSERGQAALIRQAERTCGVDDIQLDTGTGEIIVDNGRISYAQILADKEVRRLTHDPRQLVTKRMGKGVRFDPEAECPAFDHFLETSVADPEQRFWLMWRTANALFGQTPRKGFVNLIGERDSGKTTFTETMARLGGGYAVTVPIEAFLVKRSGQKFDQAELRGGRMVTAEEPEPGGRYDDGFMKAITGRGRQKTAGKYEKFVQWLPQCTPFIGSNNPIRFRTADDAMMQRHEAVRFARGYAVKDEGLLARMQAELPGILNQLLWHVAWEAKHGLPQLPPSMVAERERLATETEDSLRFVDEMIGQGLLLDVPPGQVAVSACAQVTWLYRHYATWCEDEGVRPQQVLGRKDFSKVVGRRWPAKPSNGYRFHGLVPAPGTWQG